MLHLHIVTLLNWLFEVFKCSSTRNTASSVPPSSGLPRDNMCALCSRWAQFNEQQTGNRKGVVRHTYMCFDTARIQYSWMEWPDCFVVISALTAISVRGSSQSRSRQTCSTARNMSPSFPTVLTSPRNTAGFFFFFFLPPLVPGIWGVTENAVGGYVVRKWLLLGNKGSNAKNAKRVLSSFLLNSEFLFKANAVVGQDVTPTN